MGNGAVRLQVKAIEHDITTINSELRLYRRCNWLVRSDLHSPVGERDLPPVIRKFSDGDIEVRRHSTPIRSVIIKDNCPPLRTYVTERGNKQVAIVRAARCSCVINVNRVAVKIGERVAPVRKALENQLPISYLN